MKKVIAYALIIFQIVALGGFNLDSSKSIAEQFGYLIGFFLFGIIGIILLLTSKKGGKKK